MRPLRPTPARPSKLTVFFCAMCGEAKYTDAKLLALYSYTCPFCKKEGIWHMHQLRAHPWWWPEKNIKFDLWFKTVQEMLPLDKATPEETCLVFDLLFTSKVFDTNARAIAKYIFSNTKFET